MRIILLCSERRLAGKTPEYQDTGGVIENGGETTEQCGQRGGRHERYFTGGCLDSRSGLRDAIEWFFCNALRISACKKRVVI